MMKTYAATFLALTLSLLASLSLRADDAAPPKQTHEQRTAIADSLKWQTGPITLKGGLAKINLSSHFRYLDAADSNKVLHDLWHNPADPEVLGMIFPADAGPLDKGGWAVVIDYSEEGYVKDSDADKMDYNDLLKQMQEGTKEANAEREKEGFTPLELVGWAEPPHYDKESHKLYWAKDIKAQGEEEHALNYNIRVLGRRGVLDLTALADMSDLPEVKAKTPEILGMVDFQPGNTYAEFDPKIDKVAEYGLIGLIAGGGIAAAAKLGFFGIIFKYIVVAVLALKKAIILVVVAVIAGAKKLWSKFSNRG